MINQFYLNMIFLLSAIIISLVCATDNNFPVEEMNALFDLYESTQGSSWTWYKPYIQFGYPWNFTTDLAHGSLNPCIGRQPYGKVFSVQSISAHHITFKIYHFRVTI